MPVNEMVGGPQTNGHGRRKLRLGNNSPDSDECVDGSARFPSEKPELPVSDNITAGSFQDLSNPATSRRNRQR